MTSGSDLETIPISRLSVNYYTTWALLPVTNVRIGELGYATDQGILYRWSGAAWQAITSVSTITWLATTQIEVSDVGRIADLNYTDLDLTAHTSALAKFAILKATILITTVSPGNTAQIILRRNGDTPVSVMAAGGKGQVAGVSCQFQECLIIGLDAGQVLEYSITPGAGQTVSSYLELLGYIE